VTTGTQPGLRYYDGADRDRDRATLLVTITPSSLFDLSVSYANGRENFDLELMRARPRRLSADIRYYFAAKIGVGFGLLYEEQEPTDEL